MSRGRRAYDNSSPNTLLVTRSDAIPVLNEIVVAPVTSMIRHIPTCLPVGAAGQAVVGRQRAGGRPAMMKPWLLDEWHRVGTPGGMAISSQPANEAGTSA